MRISDWSSDVCSSDLAEPRAPLRALVGLRPGRLTGGVAVLAVVAATGQEHERQQDRKSVVSGKSVSVRVDLGGRRLIKTKTTNHTTYNTGNTPYKHIMTHAPS